MKKLLLLLSLFLVKTTLCQDTIDLRKVMVIGIRGDKKTPVTQSMVIVDDIKKTYQGQEMPIILDKTPSITSQSDGGHSQGYTYFRIRGIDQSRINMTLDGIPLNEPEDQGVYTSNYPGFINGLQSMQIQRGVGTSTNGVSSYGGSISFQSQSGIEKLSEISIGGGSFNTKRMNASHSTGLSKKKLAMFSNLSIYSTDGYRYNSGGSGFSSFISAGYYGNKDIVRLTGFTGRSINQMSWLAVSESDILLDRRINYNKNDDVDNFEQSFVQMQYIKTLDKNSKLSSSIFYNRLDGMYDYFSSGKKSVRLGSNFYGIISNYQYDKKNIRVNVGINLNSYHRDHQNIEDHTQDYGIGTYENRGYKKEFSTFVKIGYDIQRISIFADMQYRQAGFSYRGDVSMDPINWNFFNPKIGVLYTQSKEIKYYLSLAKSNREPTRTNLFGGQDNLSTLSNIVPEKVIDYEMGINFRKRRIAFDANVYYMNFRNEITLLGALGSNSLPLMTNVKNSFRSGIEANLRVSSIANILVSNTNFNYSYNRINDGGIKFTPLYTPKIIINQSFEFNYSGISLEINAKYNGRSYISFDNEYYIRGFFLLGANASFTYRKYTISLQGNNLTDEKYYTNGYIVDNKRYLFTNAFSNFYATIKVRL